MFLDAVGEVFTVIFKPVVSFFLILLMMAIGVGISMKQHAKRYDGILNVALVPIETKIGDNIALVSKALNNPPSLYHLRTHLEAPSPGSSLPHCTLMHFRVPEDSVEKALLLQKLSSLSGRTILIQMNDIQSIQAPAFIRDNLSGQLPIDQKIYVKSFNVEKTAPLLKLQNEVISTIDDTDAYITGIGENYSPHFTLWVQDINKNKSMAIPATPPISSINIPRSFYCKVVIGTCGPRGQVEEIFS